MALEPWIGAQFWRCASRLRSIVEALDEAVTRWGDRVGFVTPQVVAVRR